MRAEFDEYGNRRCQAIKGWNLKGEEVNCINYGWFFVWPTVYMCENHAKFVHEGAISDAKVRCQPWRLQNLPLSGENVRHRKRSRNMPYPLCKIMMPARYGRIDVVRDYRKGSENAQ